MLKKRKTGFILFLVFFIGINGAADPLVGTAGSLSYYSNELGKFGIGSGEEGPDGSLTFMFPVGSVMAAYNSTYGAWAIGRTSGISREIKWGVPKYSDDDIFLLDGIELVYATGANPKIYYASKQNYMKIEYFNPGQTNSYWVVTSPDGGKRYYGNTNDSRIEAVGRPAEHPRVWALSRQQDSGNFGFTVYVYSEDTVNGGYYLMKMILGKTGAATNGRKAIKFYYENEPNPSFSYREGAIVKNNKRPVTILEITGCNSAGDGGICGSAFKIAWLQTVYTKKPLISSITQYGTDVQLDANGIITGGSSLPPATFEYAQFTPSFGAEQDWALDDAWNLRDQTYTTADLWFSFMDINGDSLPDRVKQGYSDSGLGSDGPNHDFRVRLNNGSGFGPNQVWNSNGTSLNDHIQDYNLFTHDYTYDYLDINGDGLPDRLWQDNNTTLNFKLNTGSGFGTEQSWSSSGNYLREMDSDGNTVSDYLDMNGDGRADRICQGASTTLHIRFNNGNGFSDEVAWESSGYYLRAITHDPQNTSGTASIGDNTCDYMDMNGDGLPDRVWQGNETTLHIRFNNGNGFNSEVTWASLDAYIRNTEDDALHCPNHAISDYMDFNGDGLIDRLVQSRSSTLTVALNTGNGFAHPITVNGGYGWLRQLYDNDPGNEYYSEINTCGDYMDMNGDGLLDRVWKIGDYWHQNDPLRINICSAAAPGETFLTKVHASSGGITEYTYMPVDRTNNPEYKMKVWVLANVTKDDGFGNLSTTAYEYEGGQYDNDDRLAKGFRKIRATSPTGDYTDTYYLQEGPESGLVEKTIDYCGTDEIFKYTYNVYENYADRVDHLGHGVSQNRPSAGPPVVVQAEKLVETRVYTVDGSTAIDAGSVPGGTAGNDWLCQRKTFGYDQYGNITETTWGDYTPGSWGLDKTTEYAEYIIDTTNRWLLLPKRVYKFAYNADDVWSQSSDRKIYYDYCAYGAANDTGLVTKLEEYTSASNFLVKQMHYDLYGNVDSKTDAEGHTFTYVFDNVYKNYLTRMISPTVHGITLTTTREYNLLMLPHRETDANGAVTQLVYDVFNRVTKVISPGDDPDYPSLQYEYHDADGSASGDGTPLAWKKSMIRATTGQPGSTDSSAYLDGWGNTVQTKKESQDESGSSCWNSVKRWTFIAGNKKVACESLPFNSASPTFDRTANPSGLFSKNEEYLDSLHGNVKKTTDPSGLETYGYSKLATTTLVNPTGRVTELEVLRRLNEMRERMYTGTYPSPLLYSTTKSKETFDKKKVIDNANNEMLIVRDWTGRKLALHDPDMGTWHYAYDGNGNIISQTDAKNNTVTFEYDALGRNTRKNYPDTSFVLYNYDGLDVAGNPDGLEHGSCQGRLTRIFYAGGVGSESNVYDSRGRVTQITKTIDGKNGIVKYDYNSIDQIVKETLPDGEQIQYAYSEGGGLQSVAGIYDCVSDIRYTPLQKLSSFSYGNGVITTYEYYDEAHGMDPCAGISNSQRLKHIGTNKLGMLNLEYRYDKTGNVKEKNDLEFTEFTEIYLYDDLNRLTGASSEIYGAKAYVYDEINNILSKDNRTYSYLPGRPHAVSNDGVFDYIYDNNGNMTEKREGGVLVRGLTYDYENRVTGMTDGGSFAYDDAGKRILKQEGDVKTIYFFSDYEEVYTDGVKTNTLKYYSAGAQRVAQYSSTDGLFYIHTDHLGSSVRLSDAAGALVNITTCGPFGEAIALTMEPVPDNLAITDPQIDVTRHFKAKYTIDMSAQVGGVSDVICESGETIKFHSGFRVQKGARFRARINASLKISYNLGTVKPKYTFTGKELDSNGLYYFGARFYDPALGRFISPDNVLDGLNRFAYCGNNPVRFVDPSGHGIEAPLVIMIVSVLGGAYLGGVATTGNWAFWQWDFNSPETWYGIFTGAMLGGAAGSLVTAGVAGLGGWAKNWGLSGELWGIVSSSFGAAGISMGVYAADQALSGQPITAEGLCKNGFVGGGTGIFVSTGGLGLLYLAKKMGGGVWSTIAGLLSEAACTFGSSIGYNWANNRDLFESFVIGVGPLAVPFRNGGLSSDWQDWVKGNIGNITMNTLGLLNILTGGTVEFDLQNLTPVYSGGWLQSVYKFFGTLATGYYTVIGDNAYKTHEFNHIWQSRMFGNLTISNSRWQFAFIANYFWQGLLSGLSGSPIFGDSTTGENNWYEIQAYNKHWF